MAFVASAVAFAAAAAPIKIEEGTEFPLRLEETISSKTASAGDRFAISLAEDVKLSDGTVLRAGYRGVGEVTEARDNGALGKTGKLNIAINYLKVGDERIKLRANRGSKGDNRTGAQVTRPARSARKRTPNPHENTRTPCVGRSLFVCFRVGSWFQIEDACGAPIKTAGGGAPSAPGFSPRPTPPPPSPRRNSRDTAAGTYGPE